MKTKKTLFLLTAVLSLIFPFSTMFSQGTWGDVLWTGDDPIARNRHADVDIDEGQRGVLLRAALHGKRGSARDHRYGGVDAHGLQRGRV